MKCRLVRRPGWFVPVASVHRLWQEHGIVLDHWRSFQSSNVTSRMDLTHDDLLHTYTRLPGDNGYYCKDPRCDKGIYVPTICKKSKPKSKSSCATLVAGYPGEGPGDCTLSFSMQNGNQGHDEDC